MNLRTFNVLMWFNRPTVQAAVIGLALLLVAPFASALQLIVLDDPQCGYCREFKRAAGSIYNDSPYGKWAPIIYVTYSKGYSQVPDDWPEWFSQAVNEGRIGSAEGTPTFILYDTLPGTLAPREIGRIEGYGGSAWFYDRLENIRGSYEAWKAQLP